MCYEWGGQSKYEIKRTNERNDEGCDQFLQASGAREKVGHASEKKNVVHAKIKKHPLFLFGREPLKSYKRMKRAHCLEGGLETTQKR